MGQLAPGLIEVHVVYGIGASFQARFDIEKIVGWSARKIIQDAIDRPRPPGSADRTAKVLDDALREGRELDVELVEGPSDSKAGGKPITMEHVVVPQGDATARTLQSDTVTIQVSESYKGG
jgi:hypothetical protein